MVSEKPNHAAVLVGSYSMTFSISRPEIMSTTDFIGRIELCGRHVPEFFHGFH
jgi:hypothetical protein